MLNCVYTIQECRCTKNYWSKINCILISYWPCGSKSQTLISVCSYRTNTSTHCLLSVITFTQTRNYPSISNVTFQSAYSDLFFSHLSLPPYYASHARYTAPLLHRALYLSSSSTSFQVQYNRMNWKSVTPHAIKVTIFTSYINMPSKCKLHYVMVELKL